MDERKVHIDEFFARQMENKAETPPTEVWHALDKRLDASAGRKKRFPVWWFWAIGGLILLSATGIIANYSAKDSSKEVQSTSPTESRVTKQPAETTSTEERDNTTMPSNEEVIANNVPSTQSRANSNTSNNSNNQSHETKQIKNVTAQKQKDILNQATQNPMQTVTTSAATSNSSQKLTKELPKVTHSKDDVAMLHPKPAYTNTYGSSVVQQPSLNSVTIPTINTKLPKGEEARLDMLNAANAQKQLYGIPVSEPVASLQPMPQIAYESTLTKQLSATIIKNKDNDVLYDESNATQTQKINIPIDTPDKDSLNNTAEIKEPKVRKKISLPIELGVKAGYAAGFDREWRANKVAFAPYINYKLPKGFSLIFQPTYHTGNANIGTFANGEQNYYNITGSSFDSTGRVVRGVIDSTVVTANPPDTVYRTYTYRQTYDSIHTSYSVTQRAMWDVELPLMLKYDINNNFSVMVGASATYSSVLQTEVKEETYSLTNEYVEDIEPETFFVTYQGQQPPEGPPRKGYDDIFNYTGESFTNYNPRQSTNSKSFMRYGFMIGASYNFNERWMIDIMMHKTGVNTNAVPDKELQRLYTQPYLRIMVGYKFFKTKSAK